MSKLYRIHTESKTLQGVKEIEFADHKFKERYDIQEWVESTPQIIGEELLIIAKEKTAFEGTKERPDLIALDKTGNIVVIELKRDDSGTDVHWQAIKYAAYWSSFKNQNIINVYKEYLEKKDCIEYTEEVVQDKILDFIDEDNFESLNNRQRIILVSHNFSREVISAAKWLIDGYNMDLKCVQLIPYYDSDIDVYNLMSNTLLPLPGIDDYLVKPLGRKEFSNTIKGAVRKNDEVTNFLERIRDGLIDSDDLLNKPSKNSRWAGVAPTFRYYHFWFREGYWSNWNMSYRVWKFNSSAEKELTNKFGVYLTLNRNNLLAGGMSEIEYEEIREYLSKAMIAGFDFEGDDEYCSIGKLYESDELSDINLNKIISDLVFVMNATKQKIDQILNA